MLSIVLGTRAEFIKMFPVMQELEKRGEEYLFIHTGQHSLDELCQQFNVKMPDIVLSRPPITTTKFFGKSYKAIGWSIKQIFEIKRILDKKKVSVVLYHGDTMTTANAAIASSYILNKNKKFTNVHLEAGLRSMSIWEPFPEEISRRIADRFSDILFAVSKRAKINLKKEKVRGKIFTVGNTVVDSALIAYKMSKKSNIEIPEEEYAIATVHRHENIKSKERMERIVRILKSCKIKTLFIHYDNTIKQLKKFGLYTPLIKKENVAIIKLLSYIDFIKLLGNSKYLITDGGSVQEESLIFKKPCIILRNRTERVEGLETGINFLTHLNVEYAKKIIETIEKEKLEIPEYQNPYGKRGVSNIIVKYLMEYGRN